MLKVLHTRGVAVSDEQRTLIAECTDLALVESWLHLAVTAEKIQDLGDQFAG